MELAQYLDTAKTRGNIASDTKLSIAMGVSPAWAHMVRTGKMLPSDEAMLRLADLAGVSPDIALLDLSRARAVDPRVRSTWANILQRIAVTLLLLLLPVGATRVSVANAQDAKAPYKIGTTVYYQKSRSRFRAKVLALVAAIFRLLLTNVAYSR